MQHPHRRISLVLVATFAFATIFGCGAQESSELSAAKEDRWLDAWGVEQMYSGQIQIDAINAGEDPNAADKSCETMLEMARNSLSDSGNVGTVVQIMYKTCADAGLKFQNKVRCEAERLQVLCR